ncbi:MAG: PKD domain-containing protein [Bacteroidia bacterium]
MIKKLSILVCLFIYATNSFAQICVPDGQYTAPGIYPDSVTGMPDAPLNISYAETITLVIPTDTSTTIPTVETFTINYYRIDSVIGLPPDFSYSCEPSNCQIAGGSSGCILISGGAIIEGDYNFTIYFTPNLTHQTLGTFDAPATSINNRIRVGAGLGSNLPIADFIVQSTATTGESVLCSNNSTYATSYSWEFPGGTPASSTSQNGTTVYNTAGTYTITLTATNINGFDTVQHVVHVTGPPTVVPDSTGFYPNCQTGLAQAQLGVYYNDTIFTTIPSDTTMDFPGVGVVTLTINYMQIDSVIGLPPGMTYTSYPSNQQIAGGSSGFVIFSGYAADEGVFPFSLYRTMNVSHQLLGTFNSPQDSVMCELIVGQYVPCSAGFSLYPDSITEHNWYAENTCTGSGPLDYTWYWGDGASSTGSNPSHTYSTPGYYNICVEITAANACTDSYCDSSVYIFKTDAEMISVTVVGGPTGIEEMATQQLSIYPNPANALLTIEAQTGKGIYQLIDITGKTLLQGSVPSPKFTLDISSLSSGVYFISVSDSERQMNGKVVKE